MADVLDLGHDAEIRGADGEFLPEAFDVLGAVDERQVDEVGVPGHEREVGEILEVNAARRGRCRAS